MKSVAVIGLGIMGHGIADNFLKHGHEVFVWNREASKADDLVSRGAKVCATPQEATEKSEIVFEVTANDESSRAVWLGNNGILSGAKPGQFLIACPTLTVDWIDELANECKNMQLNFFDMPMTGSRAGAEGGQLVLLVGGDKQKLEELKPVLNAIAKDVKYFGPVGSGTKFKLILNTLQGIHLLGFGEALAMAKESGLDVELVGSALAEIPGGTTTNLAWKNYQSEPQQVNFAVEWEAKDLGYARQMAKDGSYPLGDKARDKFQKAVKDGRGKDDWTKINKL